MEYRNTLTTCTYCGCGCNLFLESVDGKLTGTIPCKTSPINEGKLCIKGWNVHEFVQSEKRLTKPLMKKDGELKEVSWDEALDFTASKLREIKDTNGGDAVGFFASAKVTNEENYIMQKFARAAVGTNSVDHCARLWHSSTVAGLAASFGSGAMTNGVAELEQTDTIFIIGSNTATSHPLVATRIFRALERGAKVLVADPRKNQIADFAELYVRHKPGTDVALLNGMMKVILDKGLEDNDFIKDKTEEYEAFKAVIEKVDLEEMASITGVSVEDITTLALTYAESGKSSIVYCMGITQHTNGVNNVKSLANLAMLTGHIGKAGTGVNPLRGQNNVQGACDMGGLPNVYTGYQPVTLGEANKKFADAWGVDALPTHIGLTIPEMMDGIDNDEVKALWVMGENPVVSDPDADHVVKALEKVELLIVQDIFLTPTAKLADVVLPGVSFAEKDGTFVNTERRVLRVRKAIDPIGESRQDWEIIKEISNRFGYQMDYDSPESIFNEIAQVTPSYAGISYDRLEGDGLQWPCPSPDHPGTPFLHKDGKFTRGKGLFHAIEYNPPAEVIDSDYPFWMTTGRVYAHYHTGTMTRNSKPLDFEVKEGFLEINPKDAGSLDLQDGGKIKIASRRGEIETRVMITERVEQGVVFMPFHFEEANVNKLTNPAYDPIAKIPELKVCAVKLEKVS